jgi:choline dehydrogenase-like flavoprotein
VTPIVVVGSGASAVHFTLSALEKGRQVVMLDVGYSRPAPVMPDATLNQLKAGLADPVRYFLGDEFESVLFPGGSGEYYGFPPSKTYVFSGVPQFRWRAEGFQPLVSFAQGGLAEAWTGGVYPFNEAEFADFPFGYADIEPYYDLVAQRIGISGSTDDLARFMPVHRHMMPPLELDQHSKALLDTYYRQRGRLNEQWRCYMGRSRVAALSRDSNGRRSCRYLGRCLWGCPSQSLYTPRVTLDECRRYEGFRHRTGVYVRHFTVSRNARVRSVVIEAAASGRTEELPVETLVLGAGALSSCRIFLESVYRATGERVTLTGLMDNQQILMPFVNLSMLRRTFNPESYQYHQLGLGIEGASLQDYVHGQITTLKTALFHPLVQSMPFDLRTGLSIFGNVHAALGLVNINLSDRRRATNTVMLEPASDGPSRTLIHYEVGPEQVERIRAATKRVRRVLQALDCVVPPGMTHRRPMGASVHYAGLLPMSEKPAAAWTTSPEGRSREFDNLYFIDGTTFPFLPAKNLTFTLMANAARIADRVC